MNATQWTKRQVIINGAIHSVFFAMMIYGTASGLVWRVPHIPQATLFFALGVDAAVWGRLLLDRSKGRSNP
jgi:hypothetical protein